MIVLMVLIDLSCGWFDGMADKRARLALIFYLIYTAIFL